MMRTRYRPISLSDIRNAAAPYSLFFGFVISGIDFVQSLNPRRRSFFCSAPLPSMRQGVYNPLCFQEIHVSEDDEEIPYICERCGFYFDWLEILTKYVKVCPECNRCLEMRDSRNFCNRHGERRVHMEVREVRISLQCSD
jgi:hypothetical protein